MVVCATIIGLRGHSHIESSHGLRQTDASGNVGGSSSLKLRFDT